MKGESFNRPRPDLRLHTMTTRSSNPRMKKTPTGFFPQAAILGVSWVLFTPCLHAETHEFTDVQGRILRGDLVTASGDSVTIKREDGRLFTLKTADFSASDQAYIRQAAASTAKKEPPPKITPKDVRELPFCATMPTVKLNPKQKKIFDELRVTKSERIHIHGKKKWDSGWVGDKIAYHNGKLALFPPLERSGKLEAKFPTESDVRTYFAVLETGDSLVVKEVKVAENAPQAWTLAKEGGSTVLKVVQGTQTIATVSAPTAEVTGAGFAATVRWVGNEADMSITFDD